MRRRLCFSLLLAVALTALVTAASRAATAVEKQVRRCNGMVALCDRTVGEVVFATSHNSMSSPADGFRGPNQGKPMSWQLEHGVRGFQIDAYEGVARGNSVYTELSGPFGTQATDLPAALVAAAVRIHQHLGAPPPGTPTDVYLCHTFCELGAVPLADVADDVRGFLDRHPHEVLVFVIEDYVTPERLHAVLAAHGLARELVAVEPGAPLPALGEMIDAQTRLLVTLENGDRAPTLPNAFTGVVEETPFTFVNPTALRDASSCTANRGVDGSPIFQFNHWVTPPTRQLARAANALLADRVDRCTELRGRRPTLVAVDFADRSNVVELARRLNRAATVNGTSCAR